MRVRQNIYAINSHRQLSTNTDALGKSLEKLSSGLAVNRAGDNAAGLAISEKMRAQMKGLDTAQKNAQDAISVIQSAEGALIETHSMLNRMVELATQAGNGIYNTEERGNIALEITALTAEIDRIALNTDFNGTKLLDGSLTAMQLQVGDTAAQTIQLAISSMGSTSLGIAALSVTDAATASGSIATVKLAISEVSTQRATLGAMQNRLEHTVANLGVQTENITAAEARIRDTDMAKEMMNFTKNNILNQAAQSMLAQANQVPQGVLQLLQ
jgi:flagellin